MPKFKYQSHNTSECKDKKKFERNMSGGAAKRDEGKRKWQKENKSLAKKLLKTEKKMKKLSKTLLALKKTKEFRKLKKRKKKKYESSDSDSESDSNSDSDSDSDSD